MYFFKELAIFLGEENPPVAILSQKRTGKIIGNLTFNIETR
jgi:hypothetical protein